MKTKVVEHKKKLLVELYTKPTCNYCINAKNLLEVKKIEYTEYDVTKNASFSKEAIERSGGRRTVPQIFINGKHIGGYGELKALNDEGKLESMLAE
ncbi:MAG: glutaredoxin 3 [Candidatus Paracaedibacteraceae bacterium]|nr:glutaredoxin 3 [Candidatus Paracaedibacteraceae bacterium]